MGTVGFKLTVLEARSSWWGLSYLRTTHEQGGKRKFCGRFHSIKVLVILILGCLSIEKNAWRIHYSGIVALESNHYQDQS